MNQKTTHICFQCNSKLILISKVTEKLEGSLFAQTNTVYRCSNNECQERKDKEAVKRMEAQKEKDSAEERRNQSRLLHNKASE